MVVTYALMLTFRTDGLCLLPRSVLGAGKCKPSIQNFNFHSSSSKASHQSSWYHQTITQYSQVFYNCTNSQFCNSPISKFRMSPNENLGFFNVFVILSCWQSVAARGKDQTSICTTTMPKYLCKQMTEVSFRHILHILAIDIILGRVQMEVFPRKHLP